MILLKIENRGCMYGVLPKSIFRASLNINIYSTFFILSGIAILYKKPKSEPPGFFSFLSPFKSEVWLLVFAAYVGVSLSFFIIARYVNETNVFIFQLKMSNLFEI